MGRACWYRVISRYRIKKKFFLEKDGTKTIMKNEDIILSHNGKYQCYVAASCTNTYQLLCICPIRSIQYKNNKLVF